MSYDADYVMCECPLEPFKSFVEEIEKDYPVRIVKSPDVCLTMVRAEDSLEKQEFYLGEVLTTECEVEVQGEAGYGLCIGEEPARGYCIAVMDALVRCAADDRRIKEFLDGQAEAVHQSEKEEYARTLQTRVDFKLMEED